MLAGYMGKLLFVDLSSGEIKEERPDESLYRNYLGGYGIGVRILYSRQKAGVDPLGPENTLGLISGPCTGTLVPTGARYAAVAKSPLTGGWGDANSGGYFGPYLKFSGFDGVFFTGISTRPVYLLMDNGKAELKDASLLWGRDAYETEYLLTAEYGKDSRVSCIGQAGEKMALIASIMTDHGSAAGRSGLGAVMGSKRLKAVVVKGTMEVNVGDKEALMKLRMEHIKSLQVPGPDGGSYMQNMHKYGTSGMTFNSAHTGDSPVKNWGGVGILDVPDRSGLDRDVVAGYVEKLTGCWHCPISCKAILKEGTGEYAYAAGARRPEYETQASFGVLCGSANAESINKVNDICNRYGLDTISAGTVVAFAIECYENGIFTRQDTEGIELRWGNHKAIVEITEKIGKREGLGNILADGVKVAAEKIGRGAEKFAVHIGGQELGMHDPKLLMGGRSIFSGYRMDATPGRHTAGFGPNSFSKMLVNSMGLCFVGFGFGAAPDVPAKMAGFMAAVTGQTFTVEEMLKTGERIATLRHAFNLREGIYERNWAIHPRIIGNPPLKEGPLAGVTAPMEAQDCWSLGAMDWDLITGKPSKKKLLSLGLDEVAEELWPPVPSQSK
ncbi:MAG: aldehyde ferredoxin oxidoreductase family protein [Dehalococcoidales bacterium]|nr:aldehyde ferredoxin oxidoreductase family protein [Dehalococcoidales bacterium]